jgi:phage nucleotide-binding protein
MNAIVYAPSGGGKTVNSTLARASKRGKNLLICTDNSSIVLQNFDRKNLTVKNVGSTADFIREYHAACESKAYDNIIGDNLSDLTDMWLLELQDSGKFKDMRQAYAFVYNELKRLTRKSTMYECNTIFTCWSELIEVPQPSGETIYRYVPKIREKIRDNICGLMNVVAFVTTAEKDGKKVWYYVTQGSPSLMAKDQILCRASCMPEDIFGK